jgi:phosphoribosylformimino-5-aminoimidazole carboxamide ribotide isomerase
MHVPMEVIPAIDLLDGQCVRLRQGDFGQVQRYPADPVALARDYASAGARRLHLVDLDGARAGEPRNGAILEQIAAATSLAVQCGGGIRRLEQAQALRAAGARRVVIGSVAVEDRATTAAWLEALEPANVVLAFDVRLSASGEPLAAVRGWLENTLTSLWDLVAHYLALGARDFLVTDISRDGMLEGANLALYTQAAQRFPAARFTASGGVAGAADLHRLADSGVAAVVVGKALLDGRLTPAELVPFWRAG